MPNEHALLTIIDYLSECNLYDPSAGSPYGNHVTTFPSSPHYNIKETTSYECRQLYIQRINQKERRAVCTKKQ